jgi:hypothetical protein
MDSLPDGYFDRFPDGAWEYRVRSLARLRGTLGEDVLVALCRCHVHVNRLLSFAHYRELIRRERRERESQTVLARAVGTILWLEVGTMSELAASIGALNGAIALRGWKDLQGLAPLVEVQDRWERKKQLRNRGAFHVDAAPIREGLKRLPQSVPVVMVEGDSNAHFSSGFPLADHALHNGLQSSQPEADELALMIVADRETVVREFAVIVLALLKRAGLEVVEGIGSGSRAEQ